MHKIISLLFMLTLCPLTAMDLPQGTPTSASAPSQEKDEYVVLRSNEKGFRFHRMLLHLRLASIEPVLNCSFLEESQTNVIDVSNMIDEGTLERIHKITEHIQNKKYHRDKDFPSAVLQEMPHLRTLAVEPTFNLVKAAHFFEDAKFLAISARLLAKKVFNKECSGESLKPALPLEAWQEVNRQHFLIFKSFPASADNQEKFTFTTQELALYAHEYRKMNSETRRYEFAFPEHLKDRIELKRNAL